MPARVFVALLTTEDGCLTAAELSALLQASPGAISDAVRYLILVNVVSRERRSGSRRDWYRVHDDAWYEAALHRERLFTRWKSSMQEGITALGPETRAGERLAETIAFFDFIGEEVPALLERWRIRRAELRDDGRAPARRVVRSSEAR
jgi:predicted transcriptional regulator